MDNREEWQGENVVQYCCLVQGTVDAGTLWHLFRYGRAKKGRREGGVC